MDIKSVIRKEPDGYYVFSEEGKKLGGPYKTREEAEKRLRQVEFWKRRKATRDESPVKDFIPFDPTSKAVYDYMEQHGLEADWQGFFLKDGQRVAYKQATSDPAGIMVVWIDPSKRTGRNNVRSHHMTTRADLERTHGEATRIIAEKAIGIAQAVRRMFGGIQSSVIRPYTDQIGVKARQLYNETHTKNWTTNNVPYIHLDKMMIRSAIDDLQRDIRNANVPIGMARIIANHLLDALRGLRQAIDNL